VEHVLPGQHGAAERRLPQGVAGALPFGTWSSVGRDDSARPRRTRRAAAQVQWSSEVQAQPTKRASSLRMRRSAAIRASMSSIFAAIPTRSASDGAVERRAARRYSAISASVKPKACASLIAPRKRTVSSS
jgi:hypothetical protein